MYPEGRRCPACEGDVEAARQVAEASVHAVEAVQPQRRRATLQQRLFVGGVVAVSLAAGFSMIALALV